MRPFAYERASSLDDALRLARRPGTRLLGGGTDLVRLLGARLETAEVVVDVSRVRGLDRLSFDPGRGLRAGGALRLAALEAAPLVAASWPALAEAVGGVATPQIRNVATLAGTLLQRPSCAYFRGGFPCTLRGGGPCSAAAGDNRLGGIFGGAACVAGHPSDVGTALAALGASVVLATARGRREAPVESLWRVPDEKTPLEIALPAGAAIAEVRVRPPAPGARSVYLRARDRATWAFPLAAVGAAGTVEDGVLTGVRIFAAGVGPIPWRLEEAERAALGRPIEPGAAERAAEAAVSRARPAPSATYKVPVLAALVRRAILALGA